MTAPQSTLAIGSPPRRSALALALSLAASAGAAGIGNLATAPALEQWYDTIAKPSWTPPDWVFGPVWTLLYAAQAVAAWLVWRNGGAKGALQLHGAQLLLNAGWSLVFFGLRAPGWAVIEIAVLWVAIAATVAAFRRRSRAAGWLMLPYLAWVSFAAALTVAIWWMNRS